MLTELVHQKNCKKHEMITDMLTQEKLHAVIVELFHQNQLLDLGSEIKQDRNPN